MPATKVDPEQVRLRDMYLKDVMEGILNNTDDRIQIKDTLQRHMNKKQPPSAIRKLSSMINNRLLWTWPTQRPSQIQRASRTK